ncbi:unnamed protein product [Fusarium graminearum]|uniref:Uncharacterized protein n=1 Tax=Gibberella zeae TaxID=5518 RepID=A0A4E9EFL5_GIBZA|nr:unnamed protein product [Fusarium graminearum]CAG1969890.1 unnamed protein product [Fusarium graminearum]
MYSGAIFLVNGGNAEIFKDVRFDENDEDGSLITSTGSHPSEKGECAIGDVVRQVERPGDCTGSLYILPIEQMNSHLARTDPVSASSVEHCNEMHRDKTPGLRDFSKVTSQPMSRTE